MAAITSIMQPYFLPYIGYFQLLANADMFVVYDDVNFIKKGWINRNNMLANNQANLFSIPLLEASQNKKINEIYIDTSSVWKQKLVKSIEQNYKKAPFYNDFGPLLNSLILFEDNNLAKYITHSLKEIANYLSVDTKIISSSEYFNNQHLKAQDRIIDCCKVLNTHTYINAIGGQELYNAADFEMQNITLKFIKTNPISYKQFNNEFVPYLSIIDVLFFNSKETTKQFLNEFELI
jgi:hypothetical protein